MIITCVCTTVIPGGTFVFADNIPKEISQSENTEQKNSFLVQIPKVKSETAKLFDYQQTKDKNKIRHTFKVTPSSNDTIIELPFEFNKGEYLKLYKNKILIY